MDENLTNVSHSGGEESYVHVDCSRPLCCRHFAVDCCLSQTASPRAAAVPAPRALVDQYCVVCHNQKNATAGVALNGIDFANVGGNAAVLERVLRKFRTGEMPPAGMPRPAAPAAAHSRNSWKNRSTGSPPRIPIPAGPRCTA